MIVHSLLKAAFPMRPLILCRSKAQSRILQATHRTRSVTLCPGRSASLLLIRAWQKTRLPTFRYGSLKSGEPWSTSQSRFL